MSFRILVTDDEKEIRDLIVRYLRRELFEAVSAESGEEALRCIQREKFDLIVLDIMMPGMDGFQVLSELRDRGVDSPVLFLSAKHDDISVIEGLGLGADEYMTKPFSPAVLTARVKALLRMKARAAAAEPGTSHEAREEGTFSLDRKKCEIRRQGVPLPLSALEYRILSFFIEHPEQVFTRDQLYSACWEGEYHDDNTVVVYMRRLREKIEEDPGNPVHLQTMRGLGYYFTPEARP